jgi:transposase
MPTLRVAGIDVGKTFLDVACAPRAASFRVPNAPAGIAALVGRLKHAQVGRVVIEAIGAYARPLIAALQRAGLAVGIVNPRRIKAFRDAEGRRAKNDRLDAALIARFALAMKDAIRPLPSEPQLALKALATRRRQLVEMCAMEKTRLKQAPDQRTAASCRAMIAALSAERRTIEAALEAALAADPHLCARRQLFLSIPGIGRQVATVLATDMPELGTLDRRSAGSLAGLAPHISQSGMSKGRAAIAGGRPCVRAALYMAALTAVRCDPTCKASYAAMRQAGKPAKVALIAVARKLLTIANAIAKSGQPFAPGHAPTA